MQKAKEVVKEGVPYTGAFFQMTGFADPSQVMIGRFVSGSYPTYSQLIPKPKVIKHQLSVNTNELVRAIELMPAEAHIVRLVGHDRTLRVTALDEEQNETETRVDAQGTIRIAANPRYLKDMLRLIPKEEQITIKTISDSNPLMIDHGPDTYMIMPMFVQWPERKKKEVSNEAKSTESAIGADNPPASTPAGQGEAGSGKDQHCPAGM